MVGHYPPHGGGVSNHLDNLVRELRKRHEVHVLTYGPVRPRDFEREFVHQVKPLRIFGIRGVSFAFLGGRKIVELCKEINFDIVHAHYIGTTSYAGVIAKERKNIPLVVTAHGSDLDFMSKLPLGRYFVKESLIKANAVIAVSHDLGKKALSLGAKEVHVIPNGIRELGEIKAKKEFITFIGSLTSYKSPETVVKLAKVLPEEKFLIVGDGPLKRVLEANAPENVKFLGYRRDIENILSKTKVLILPSKREGFGLVILEANSLKVPAIGRRIGGVKEIIRENKNGLTFETFEELVKEVKHILSTPKDAVKLGSTGKLISIKYSWKKVAKRVEEVYKNVLNSL
jgi:glycosyltransferase involved in cell wall biosynthesis